MLKTQHRQEETRKPGKGSLERGTRRGTREPGKNLFSYNDENKTV